MKKIYLTLVVLLSFFIWTNAQDNLNLDPAGTKMRFEVTDRTWPAEIGGAEVCLWNDDKLSAFTITIDDNMEGDIDFWKSMQEKYGFNFTWFVITQAEDTKYNVTPEGWVKYRDLVSAGNQVEGHDDRNWYKEPAEGEVNPTTEEYLARLQATVDKIETEITDTKCLTYAYPYGEGNADEARKLFISVRGTMGLLNKANHVNYLDVNSVSNPHIYGDDVSRDNYILPLVTKTATLWGVNYYRGWGSTHFHGVSSADARDKTDGFLQYLSDKGDDLWVDGFTRVAQYSQSYATHTLTVDSQAETEVKFTLTDNMLDAAFDFPLTVKIRVNNGWTNISAIQNGAGVDAKLISHEGNIYALVKAVPDAGQVIVKGIEDDDPAVITPIQNNEVQEEKTLEVGFSASTKAGGDITFSVDGNPAFGVFTDNGDNTGKFFFSPMAYSAGDYTITVLANNGTSTASETFVLTVVQDPTTQTILADKNDAAVYFPEHSFVDPADRTFIIAGGGYVDGKQMSAVFPFELPEISEGLKVVDARFSTNLQSINAPSVIVGQLDLYGLDARETAIVLVTDGFAGAYSNVNGTGIQENFANANTPVGVVSLNTDGESGLVDYLNTQYETANSGDFVFLRLSTNDVNQGRAGQMHFTPADGAEADGTPYPTLIIKFGSNLAVDDNKVNSFKLFPNPIKAGEQFSVNIEGFEGDVEIKIFSVTGQIVAKDFIGRTNKYQSKFSFEKGLYVVLLSDENTFKTQKLIVQ